METIAARLWFLFGGVGHWLDAEESERQHYRKIAVDIIDTAEPTWRRRVAVQPRARDVWDEAISAAMAHLRMGVENEPEEITGYIDQHWALIGLAKMENPYAS